MRFLEDQVLLQEGNHGLLFQVGRQGTFKDISGFVDVAVFDFLVDVDRPQISSINNKKLYLLG